MRACVSGLMLIYRCMEATNKPSTNQTKDRTLETTNHHNKDKLTTCRWTEPTHPACPLRFVVCFPQTTKDSSASPVSLASFLTLRATHAHALPGSLRFTARMAFVRPFPALTVVRHCRIFPVCIIQDIGPPRNITSFRVASTLEHKILCRSPRNITSCNVAKMLAQCVLRIERNIQPLSKQMHT